jgi:hypothetical protein
MDEFLGKIYLKVHKAPELEATILLDDFFEKIYLKVHKAPELEATMGSIKAWKAVELEKVTIRSMFLVNTIDIAKHAYL